MSAERHPLWRHIGLISVSFELFDTSPDKLAKMLYEAQAVVVRTDHRFESRTVDFWILSPLLPDASEGVVVPRYSMVCQDIEGEAKFAAFVPAVP